MGNVTVTLTNKQAWITDCSDDDYNALRDYWAFMPKGAMFDRRYKMWVESKAREERRAARSGTPVDTSKIYGWDGKIKFFSGGSLPSGLFRATREDAEKVTGVRFKVSKDFPDTGKLLRLGFLSDDRHSYQNDCIKQMVRAIPEGGGIVLAATGSGKTAIAGMFGSFVTGSVLFVVDQIDLLYQSQKEIAHWLKEPVGIVGDSVYQLERVTVATIQTLKHHQKDKTFLKWYRRIRIVIVDELHEQLSRRNFKVLNIIKPIARFGLTATLQLGIKPVRLSAYAFAGPVLYRFPYAEGVKRKVLTQGKVLQLLFDQMYDGPDDPRDYQDQYREEVVEHEVKERAISAAVAYLVSVGYYVLIHVERVAHVRKLHRVFQGIPHRIAYGEIDKDRRRVSLKKFESGDIRLIIANRVFRKGVDFKRVDVVIDMAEMRSKNNAQQKFGRGVRIHEDKEILLYIDVGTMDGRFGKAARSRARALKSLGVELVKKYVKGPKGTIRVLMEFIKKAPDAIKQMKLF